jgi:hypothetical protein
MVLYSGEEAQLCYLPTRASCGWWHRGKHSHQLPNLVFLALSSSLDERT